MCKSTYYIQNIISKMYMKLCEYISSKDDKINPHTNCSIVSKYLKN
jgi:hypothetical protein